MAVIMTGGTIAKTYDPAQAVLANVEPRVQNLIADLRCDDLVFEFVDVMHRDSLDIGASERREIIGEIAKAAGRADAVLVTHGTDTLPDTAEAAHAALHDLRVPVVFTGAMVPHSVKGSDAAQNVAEALLALRILPAGVYAVLHNRILRFPGVRKNHSALTFEAVQA